MLNLLRGQIVYTRCDIHNDGKRVAKIGDHMRFIDYEKLTGTYYFHKPKLLELWFPRLCRHVYRNVLYIDDVTLVNVTDDIGYVS